jgi:hypothetical protein
VLVCHVIEFDHNHVLLDGIMCGLLPAHRKMTETDVQDVWHIRCMVQWLIQSGVSTRWAL